MENIVLILIVLLVALVALPIVALVTSNSRARELRAEMADVLSRLRNLEDRLSQLAEQRPARTPEEHGPVREPAAASHPPSEPALPAFRPSEVAPPRFAEHSGEPFIPTLSPPAFASEAPQFHTLEPHTAGDSRSLENRIGSQWFNRVGILAVLIGVAWFLKLAFDNHWIGPLGRILIGLLAGAALIAWSERFHKRGFAVFSFSLKAVGSGTLYLSLWAAFQLYGLVPAGVAFAAMIAVTAFNAFMAWIQDAELLGLYAIAGGLSTPLLVSTGGNHEITLFTYLLMLDLAVLALVVLRPWSRLLFVSFVGTALFMFAWWMGFYSQDQAPRTALFICCFFLAFALAPRLIKPRLDSAGSLNPWDGLATYLLPAPNAALSFVAFYSLLSPEAVDWAAPWLAVAFAAFYLLLMRLPKRGILRTGSAAVSPLHLATAIVFLTLAIPLKTHGRWMTIGWLAEGAVLMWFARRVQSMLVRAFALICTLLGLGALLINNPPAASRPIFNERFGTYCVAIAVFAFVAWLAAHSHDDQEPAAVMHWPNLAAASVLIVNALILLAVSLEIYNFWWLQRSAAATSPQQNYFMHTFMYAEFSYSAWFMLFGGALLAIGFIRRSAFLRWQALVLLAATIAKVFLVDMSELGPGLRILSFIGLGVLLLSVSFVYQRDWLNLRNQKEEGS